MISAGEGFKTVGACDTSQCQAIKSKLNDGCTVAAGKMREESKLATTTYQEFLNAIGPVRLSDGTVVDPSKGLDWKTMEAVSGACYNFFMERSSLPGMMPAYKPVYKDAEVTEADLAIYTKQMKNVKDKTIEECASEGGIPDGSGGCKKCDGDEKPQGGKCVEVDDGSKYPRIRIGAGIGGAFNGGYDSGNPGADASYLGVDYGEGTSKQLCTWALSATYVFGPDKYEGLHFPVGVSFVQTVYDRIVEHGDVTKNYHSNKHIMVKLGAEYTFKLTEDGMNYLSVGAGINPGLTYLNISTQNGHFESKDVVEDYESGLFYELSLRYLRRLEDMMVFAGISLNGRANFVNPIEYSFPNGLSEKHGNLDIESAVLVEAGIQF